MTQRVKKSFDWFRRLLSGFCLVGAVLVIMVGVAKGASITFTDVYSGHVLLNESNWSYSFTHNIANSAGDPEGDAYNNLTDTLSSASLKLSFADDRDPLQSEAVLLTLDDQPETFFEVDTGSVSIGVSLQQLSEGLLDVTLYRLWGDFFFTGSILTAQGDRGSVTDPASVHAPEPSTLLLLGAGLTGLGLWGGRKRLAQRKHSS